MIGIGFLAIVVLLVGLAVAVVIGIVGQGRRATPTGSRHRPGAPGWDGGAGAVEQSAPGGDHDLADRLTTWREAGLVSEEEVDAILRFEREVRAPAEPPEPAEPAPPRRRVPLVAEALGYLGGLLAVTGLVLVLSRSWADMAVGVRLGIAAVAALVLLGAGAAASEEDPALRRLRGTLWSGSTAAFVVFAVVLGDALGARRDEVLVLAGAAAAATEGGLLWRGRRRPLQQLACLAGAAVVVGVGLDLLFSPVAAGVGVWLVGVALVVLGLVRRSPPLALVDEAVGAVTAVVGSLVVAGEWESVGLPLGVVTAAAWVAAALVPRVAPRVSDQRVLGVLGALGLLLTAPGAIAYFAASAGILTGVVVWSAGVGVLYAGARRVTRLPVLVEVLGGMVVVVGSAVTGAQSPGVATVFGTATGLALLGVGLLPGRTPESVVGMLALLINIPWAINWWFPGEGRVPLILLVVGLLLVGLATLLARVGARLRREGTPPARGVGAPPATS